MQKIATKIFMLSSVLFCLLGIVVIFVDPSSLVGEIISKALSVDVFVILASFALSIAGKYLK